GKAFVPVVLGLPGTPCDENSIDGFILRPNRSGWAYKVKRNAKAFGVTDSGEFGPYDDVLDITFSPDSSRLAFAAHKDNAWTVVYDSAPSKLYSTVDSLHFTADSKHVVYMGIEKLSFANIQHVVVDQREYVESTNILSVAVAPDGMSVAAIGSVNGKKALLR